MELAAILIIPAIASGLSLLPLGRRFAAPITVAATAVVLALRSRSQWRQPAPGRLDALDEWLTCDGLGALVLALVAFVGFTAALFSWGYIANRSQHGAEATFSAITGSTIYSSCRCSPSHWWRTSP